MNETIEGLRSHLFETLRGLREGTVDREAAALINQTAQVIINSAKVEIDHIRVAGGCSRFIALHDESQVPGQLVSIQATGTGDKRITQVAGATATQYRMR